MPELCAPLRSWPPPTPAPAHTREPPGARASLTFAVWCGSLSSSTAASTARGHASRPRSACLAAAAATRSRGAPSARRGPRRPRTCASSERYSASKPAAQAASWRRSSASVCASCVAAVAQTAPPPAGAGRAPTPCKRSRRYGLAAASAEGSPLPAAAAISTSRARASSSGSREGNGSSAGAEAEDGTGAGEAGATAPGATAATEAVLLRRPAPAAPAAPAAAAPASGLGPAASGSAAAAAASTQYRSIVACSSGPASSSACERASTPAKVGEGGARAPIVSAHARDGQRGPLEGGWRAAHESAPRSAAPTRTSPQSARRECCSSALASWRPCGLGW
jgi:hypothetical protein